jgi:hypothetical protein
MLARVMSCDFEASERKPTAKSEVTTNQRKAKTLSSLEYIPSARWTSGVDSGDK